MTGTTDRRSRRRWLLAGVAAVAVVLAVAAAATVIGRQLRSPAQLAADAAPPSPSLVTVTVEKRVLAEPVVLRGQVRAGAATRVLPPAAAVGPDSVVTKVVAERGDRVREGRVLLERSGEPMFALVLPFPLYRDLVKGMRGPDVTQVQRALRRLGHTVTVTGVYDDPTAAAVAKLYADRDYAAPTGLPRAHVLVFARARQQISAVGAKVGQTLTDPQRALFELDRGSPTIVALAGPEQAALLAAGQTATVTDDAAGGTAQAKVTAVAGQPVSLDGETGFEVRFRFTGNALAADGQRAVRLDVKVAGSAAAVLAVPVTAVYSRADGSTFVTVVDDAGSVDVTVRTGRMAGGWVELLDPGRALEEGADVVVGDGGER